MIRLRSVTPLLLALSLSACAESIAVDGIPPGPVADLLAQVLDTRVRLSWSEPGDPDVAASLLVRFPATGVAGAPEPGRGYASGDPVGSGVAVFYGSGTEAEDIPICTEHVYAAWAQDAAGNWSTAPETVRVEELAAAIPGPPTGSSVNLAATPLEVSWTPPAGSHTATVRVIRKRGIAPTGPSDGELVYAGTATSAPDPTAEVAPDVSWHYAVYSCTPCGECEAVGSHVEMSPTLVQSLRQGGFVIYWRHGTADVCEDDQSLGLASNPLVDGWWQSCDANCETATARQLSEMGKEEADEIGAALREHDIPIDDLFVSEYCRCEQTALRFGVGTVQPRPELTHYVYQDVHPDRCAAARQFIVQQPAAGTNTGIVAHLFAECVAPQNGGIDLDLESGEAAIFRPDGQGGFRLIEKVKWNEWRDLA